MICENENGHIKRLVGWGVLKRLHSTMYSYNLSCTLGNAWDAVCCFHATFFVISTQHKHINQLHHEKKKQQPCSISHAFSSNVRHRHLLKPRCRGLWDIKCLWWVDECLSKTNILIVHSCLVFIFCRVLILQISAWYAPQVHFLHSAPLTLRWHYHYLSTWNLHGHGGRLGHFVGHICTVCASGFD